MTATMRLLSMVLVSLAVLALPALGQDEHGEETHAGETHGEDAHGEHEEIGAIPTIQQGLVTALTSIVVFLIVLAVLGTAVWPKIVKGLDDRAEKIKQEIASAEAAREQAKDALEEYEKNLAQARAESQKMLEQAKADQQKLAVELRAKTDLEIGELRGRAMRDIEAARKSAVSDIYAEAATLATQVAGKILERELTPTDQQRLVDETLAELGAAEPTGAGA